MAGSVGFRLGKLFADILGGTAPTVDAPLPSDYLAYSLVDDLGCDSIDLAELQLACEDEFGFTGTNVTINTVQDAINYISARMTR